MKSLFVSMLVLTSMTSFAAEIKNARQLYNTLVKTFPSAVESVGGFSTAITLRDVNCAASLTAAGMSFSCNATALNESVLESDDGEGLFNILTKAGGRIDTSSEPGTTYVGFNRISCARIAYGFKGINSEVEYSCKAN